MPTDDISIDFFTGASVAPLAAALHATCFRAPWDENAFRSALDIPGTVFEVLNISEEPAAFALYRRIVNEAEILTLGTLPESRGKGFAARLLAEGIAYLRDEDAHFLFLEVGSQNLPALRLYRAMGFLETGRRRNYYNNCAGQEDAIMMKLIL